MAIYNTPSDSANTAVRSFLTKIGEEYYGQSYNTGSGRGKKVWLTIKEDEFEGCCAYCGEKTESVSIEHLIMFNREQCGLHHPGNTVPCCRSCNTRTKNDEKFYHDWETHLGAIIEEKGGSISELNKRKKRIRNHMDKWAYPNLSSDEENAIRAIAHSLYEGIQAEVSKSVSLYRELDRTLIQGRGARNCN